MRSSSVSWDRIHLKRVKSPLRSSQRSLRKKLKRLKSLLL